MTYKDLLISLTYKKVFVRNKQINRSLQEYKLLLYLLENKGRELTYRAISKEVWGDEYEHLPKDVVRNAVTRLRVKLGDTRDGTKYIATVKEVGYMVPFDHDI